LLSKDETRRIASNIAKLPSALPSTKPCAPLQSAFNASDTNSRYAFVRREGA
jgi:hypothetical protein